MNAAPPTTIRSKLTASLRRRRLVIYALQFLSLVGIVVAIGYLVYLGTHEVVTHHGVAAMALGAAAMICEFELIRRASLARCPVCRDLVPCILEGGELAETHRFCPRCGADLDAGMGA